MEMQQPGFQTAAALLLVRSLGVFSGLCSTNTTFLLSTNTTFCPADNSEDNSEEANVCCQPTADETVGLWQCHQPFASEGPTG